MVGSALCIFLALPWVGLKFVIVSFLGYTHSLHILYVSRGFISWDVSRYNIILIQITPFDKKRLELTNY